jgi:hypothetical protein
MFSVIVEDRVVADAIAGPIKRETNKVMTAPAAQLARLKLDPVAARQCEILSTKALLHLTTGAVESSRN